MTITTIIKRTFVLASLLAATSSPVLAQDEPQSFNAFSTALANGSIVKSGEKQAMIVRACIQRRLSPICGPTASMHHS